ncbi:MAG TPA: SDR family oxidoreductase [Polyangiaceae bacterium]|nr:SDR family oxidoreductase [Polyangiaceae bacterium]
MTAVVTGASRGIGRATAVALAARGEPVVCVGRPSPALEETLAEIRRSGGKGTAAPCDLGNASDIETTARRILDTSGAPSILVNNAGVVVRKPVEALTDEDWAVQLDVNLRAPFQLTRALLPAMRAAGRGRFVHVGSITSTLGAKNASAYAASKWGLVGFSKSLAEELTDTGLMSVCILPGSVETRMLEGSGFPPRMTAEEVAKTILFFCLDAPLAHNGAVVEMFGT